MQEVFIGQESHRVRNSFEVVDDRISFYSEPSI